MKNDYDHLFKSYFLKDEPWGLSNHNAYSLEDCSLIKDLIEELGFFGFMESGKFSELAAINRCFTNVFKLLADEQPELATKVFENEVAAIGFSRLQVLTERMGVSYNPKNMYRSIESWIENYERKREWYVKEDPAYKAMSSFDISRGGRIPRVYSDLIFAADTDYELYVIQRLFELSPMNSNVHQALKLCKESNPRALFLIAVQPNVVRQITLSDLIASLALEDRLDAQKVEAYWRLHGRSTKSNDILAKFITPGLRNEVAGVISQGLLFGDIETESPTAVLYNKLIDYIESMECKSDQNAWLMSLAKDFRSAFKRANHMAAVNHFSGRLIVNLMIRHSVHDDAPLKALLAQVNPTDPDEGLQNALRAMLFDACFAKPITLRKDSFDRCYGPLALHHLASDGVLVHVDKKYLWKPMLASSMPEPARKAYAEVIVGILLDEQFRSNESIKTTEELAQSIVDARMLTRRHWRIISENESAAAFMSKARLSPGILAIVGERMQEMTFGADMGL